MSASAFVLLALTEKEVMKRRADHHIQVGTPWGWIGSTPGIGPYPILTRKKASIFL
jgi:hypothetical protein